MCGANAFAAQVRQAQGFGGLTWRNPTVDADTRLEQRLLVPAVAGFLYGVAQGIEAARQVAPVHLFHAPRIRQGHQFYLYASGGPRGAYHVNGKTLGLAVDGRGIGAPVVFCANAYAFTCHGMCCAQQKQAQQAAQHLNAHIVYFPRKSGVDSTTAHGGVASGLPR